MPEFGKPEEKIPLVVPDTPPRKPNQCTAFTKAGAPCPTGRVTGKEFCFLHEPSLKEQRDEWRRLPKVKYQAHRLPGRPRKCNYLTREQVLEVLSKRLTLWLEKYGEVIDANVDGVICDLARTYACVAKTEAAEGEQIRGWRMKKGTG